mmetsp:Transcript_6556/g.16329  ORF Transcript_6556/g.16329 Transcript_6556/m.16329 type:complete len:214 (-) Transcript_6556:71-712(-)
MVSSATIITKSLALLQAFLLLATHHGVADAFGSSWQRTCPNQRQHALVHGGIGFSPSSGARTKSNYFSVQRTTTTPTTTTTSSSSKTRLCLVSEEDVIEAVEIAEALWGKALEARKEANALIDRAEEEANASAGTAKEAENIFMDKSKPVSMEQLVQVDNAAKASLEATNLVNEAMKASDAADQLESEAEEALKRSEKILDQHLIDYPDSELA